MKRNLRLSLFAVALTAAFIASPAFAQLTPYSQDFEALDPADPLALADDGWLVFGNVFSAGGGSYLYGYGPFIAPNGTPGFSSVATGQGGPDQGNQQVVIYSDYNNGDHAVGNWIEANVFQEQIVGAADVGMFWRFEFDAKRGDINDPNSPACPCGMQSIAFIKTLDPNAGFALTNFLILDTTNLPDTWDTYELTIEIDPSLVGQIFQIGFATTGSNYEPSGNFYDNINFESFVPLDCVVGPDNGAANVVVGSCDSGVANATLESGCTMNDGIYECQIGSPHHGGFVSCVAALVNTWADRDVIAVYEKGRIMSCAARNNRDVQYGGESRGVVADESRRNFSEMLNRDTDGNSYSAERRSRGGR